MNYRNAKFYDLRIKASCKYKINGNFEKNQTKPLSFKEIAQQIEKLYKNSALLQKRSNGVCFYLADCLLDKDRLLLLINKSDSTAPDPTISNPDTQDRKTLKKPEGYGNAHSAHVLISLQPTSMDPNVYHLVYESVRGSGIYGTHIRSFISLLLTSCRKNNPDVYLTAHPAGIKENGETVQVNSLHACELSGKISDDFMQDLNQGYLEGIELINYDNKGKPWDTGGSISEKKKSLMLDVKSQPLNKITALQDVFKKAGGYKEARVRFKDNRDASQAVSLFTDNFTLVDDDKYVKKTKITVTLNDDSSFSKIHSEIKNELYKIL